VTDINESVRTGAWIGDCFMYTNTTNRLNYLVGDQVYTISHFDQPMYLLGYLPRDGRVYACDKDVGVTSFAIAVEVLEYQTLVLRGDMESAADLLASIPMDQLNKIARFLEGQGFKDLALDVATDPEHRFDLALALNRLDIALEIAKEADVEHKWKTVGDAALTGWDIALAEQCFAHAKDLGSLLLLYTNSGNRAGLKTLSEMADAAGGHNIAFSALWQLGDVEGCIALLVRTGRVAEAVLFSQTYAPRKTPALVKKWKEGLEKAGRGKVGRLIGEPPRTGGNGEEEGDGELFPEWEQWLRLEEEGTKGGQDLIDVDGEVDEKAEEKEVPIPEVKVESPA
jgi:coatomer subunit beta'